VRDIRVCGAQLVTPATAIDNNKVNAASTPPPTLAYPVGGGGELSNNGKTKTTRFMEDGKMCM